MRHARSCYDHLAGRIAVNLFERWSAARVLRWRGEQPPCVDGSWRVRSSSWKEIAGGRSNNSAGHDTVMSWLTGLTVIYIYRTSGEDDSVLPRKWDSIPGAHGCTPQSCSFRDHQNELAD